MFIMIFMHLGVIVSTHGENDVCGVTGGGIEPTKLRGSSVWYYGMDSSSFDISVILSVIILYMCLIGIMYSGENLSWTWCYVLGYVWLVTWSQIQDNFYAHI